MILITAAGVGDLLLHGSLGVVLIQVPCSKYNPDIRGFFFSPGVCSICLVVQQDIIFFGAVGPLYRPKGKISYLYMAFQRVIEHFR